MKYYKTAFAQDGIRVEVPDVGISNNLGYNTGYTVDYELPKDNPARKRIAMDSYNEVLFSATENIKQWQDNLFPEWSSVKENGYKKGQVVELGGVTFQSLFDNNTDITTTNKWMVYVMPSGVQNVSVDQKQWQTIENSAADLEHDIKFFAGKIADSTGTKLIETPDLIKSIATGWVKGDGGGLFSGVATPNTTYHLFVIMKEDGTTDAGFDDNPQALNIPAGYTSYRRIASLYTDASSNLVQFYQQGDYFGLKVNAYDLDGGSPDGTAQYVSLSVPSGLGNLTASTYWTILVEQGVDGFYSLLVSSTLQDDVNPGIDASLSNLYVFADVGVRNSAQSSYITAVDGNPRVRYRSGTNIGALLVLRAFTNGWTDDRG